MVRLCVSGHRTMLNQSQNSLFNSALKQSSAVRKDLDAFADAPSSSAALQGQISAALTSFSRTIDDYDNMSKRELIPAKQEKAYARIKSFRAELADYRAQFDNLKKEREDTVRAPSHEMGQTIVKADRGD